MAASTTISARLGVEEAALIEQLAKRANCDKSTFIKTILRQGIKAVRMDSAAAAFAAGEVTLSKAAEMAGFSLWDFMAAMPERNLDLHYDVAEFAADLAALDRLPGKK